MASSGINAEPNRYSVRGGRVGTIFLALGLLAGCSDAGSGHASAPSAKEVAANAPSVVGFSGGCKPFTVYAQNRWDPLGAALRAAPDIAAEKIGGFAGNTPTKVDGYVKAAPAYPNNAQEYQGENWFHDTLGGWITSAAVRAAPTEYDATGLADGGPLVPIVPACQGKARTS